MAKLNPSVKGTFIQTMIDGIMRLTNKKEVMDPKVRLAGGAGAPAAIQGNEGLLRRAVMACLLWEDLAYEKGSDVSKNIATLIPTVEAEKVFEIALEARTKQKLRHVPLFMALEMLKYEDHRAYVARLLPLIITRADMLTDIMGLYFKDGKRPVAKALQKGLAAAFANFDEYQFAKYDRDNAVKLRDVLFLTHPKPSNAEREELYKRIANRTMATPDTWEVALSSGADKNEAWSRLLQEKKLGALALLRNLRNMTEVGVKRSLIIDSLASSKSQWLLPLNFLSAYKENPDYIRHIEGMMFRMFGNMPKLQGHTVFVVDVSGSMSAQISAKSKFNRMEVASAMAVFAMEMCEDVTIYATAGGNEHKTKKMEAVRGFGMIRQITEAARTLGGGGIYTRQCLEYIKNELKGETPERIVVFSDSQDCDTYNRIPAPFGTYNYIVDVSSHARGVNYKGVWTAEISGWSEQFLSYIAAFEGLALQEAPAE